jgi:hypothetical protein
MVRGVTRSHAVAVLADMVLASGAAAAGIFDPATGVVAAGAAVGISDQIKLALAARAQRNLEAAADGMLSTGQDVAGAFETLLQSAEGLALVSEVLADIATAAFEEKARALGTCIGRAAKAAETSEAAIEAESAWVRLINLLHKPHVVALVALGEPEYEKIDESILGASKANKVAQEFARLGAFQASLQPYDDVTGQSVRADLVSWGLAKSVYGEQIGLHGGALDSDTFWRRTSHGDQVVRRLRADAGAAAPERA